MKFKLCPKCKRMLTIIHINQNRNIETCLNHKCLDYKKGLNS